MATGGVAAAVAAVERTSAHAKAKSTRSSLRRSTSLNLGLQDFLTTLATARQPSRHTPQPPRDLECEVACCYKRVGSKERQREREGDGSEMWAP